MTEEIVVREVDQELIGDKNNVNKVSQNNIVNTTVNDASTVVEQNTVYQKNVSTKTNSNSKQRNIRNNLDQYGDEFYDNFSVVDAKSKKINKKVKFEIKMTDANDTKHGSVFINLKKAYNCYRNEDYELAVFFYKKAYEENKDSVEAQFGLGVSYQLLHQYDQAIETYLSILSKNYSRKKIVHNLLLCLKHKSYKEALDILLSIDSSILGYSDILSQIGLIYMNMHDDIKAISAFNKAYELSPMNPVICYNLGVLYDRQNNLDYAKHFLELALKNDISDLLSLEEFKQLEKRMSEINKQILDEITQSKKK